MRLSGTPLELSYQRTQDATLWSCPISATRMREKLSRLLFLVLVLLSQATGSHCSELRKPHYGGKKPALREPLLFVPGFDLVRRNFKPETAVRSGPPSWVPWHGTNSPIIETDKEALLKRERCKLCRGTGLTSCRPCLGRGHIRGHSRSLRSASSPLAASEMLYCDTRTGLYRAVEISECMRCHNSGRVRCALCTGSGRREDAVAITKLKPKTDGTEDGEDGPEPVRYPGGRR